ncbi:Carboxypeptidase C protein [Dioscorea alata]|uniref:Carboxypeptidase C protein n=6 Tax=Dioscorea alata TaxID=55571 RepID=A0ACB7UF02_DIOAL|nr:Carboxypeptidase C protein [Dioscorea alata]KAH7658875.1 Carboxypeptidase C protein [Dioscorea alata]KAH7658876.1 Carboxypeptidase C protein [Dioscorea alata]KAH7658877.1 Carboxypeptidase C protein [Dioscorea alata]KAH7658878.1 Carboxypeptidase C protein [Dioscorea alata]
MSFIWPPAGVGLSYFINKSDYHTRRPKTVADTHLLLLKVVNHVLGFMFPNLLRRLPFANNN